METQNKNLSMELFINCLIILQEDLQNINYQICILLNPILHGVHYTFLNQNFPSLGKTNDQFVWRSQTEQIGYKWTLYLNGNHVVFV